MHVQIINFQLKDMSDSEYRKVCDDLAPAFAAVPGLVAKVWLASPATCQIPQRLTEMLIKSCTMPKWRAEKSCTI